MKWQKGFYKTKEGRDCLAIWPSHLRDGDLGQPICLITPLEKLLPEDESHADLIVAAPELLSALKEMTYRYELLDKRLVAGQHNEPNGTIERAKKALRQAGVV